MGTPGVTALDLLAGLRLEDGRSWGEAATDWQTADARAILDPDPPNLHYLTRPRGASKTTDLAGVGIAALLEQLPPGSRSYGFAADQDQAALLLDSLGGFLQRTPEVRGALRLDRWRATASTGATFEVMASDAPSAFGLRPHLVVVDELARWPSTPGPRRLLEAIVSALPKVAGSRLVILTSAGDPAHPSHKLLTLARTSAAWRTSETPGPCPWASAEDLAEQRRLLPESSYRQLHLNQWTAAEDRLTSLDDLRACVTLDGHLAPREGLRYVVGLDLGLVSDRTVAAVCHSEGEVVALDRMQVWAGSRRRPVRLSDVEEWVEQAHQSYNSAPVVLDPWQAVGMAQRLRSRGLRVEEYAFSSQSVGRLATNLHLLLRDHRLALPDDEELIEELANVRLRESAPGVYRLDHDSDRHDDRVTALALAAHHLVSRVPRRQVEMRLL